MSNEWISLKTDLPKFSDECSAPVLMFFSTHIESGVFYMDPLGRPYHVFFDGDSLSYEPTHWMPLPSPPDTGEK